MEIVLVHYLLHPVHTVQERERVYYMVRLNKFKIFSYNVFTIAVDDDAASPSRQR